MKKPTIPKLATTLAIPGGLLIAGVWLILWACRCRHRSWQERPNEEGFLVPVCDGCGEIVEVA